MTLSEDPAWFTLDERSGDSRVRRAATALAERLGFGEARCGEVGIVASEVTTNLARHAGGGAVALRRLGGEHEVGVGLLALDAGPGIGDVAQARRDGHSSAGTLGIGLGAIDRLSASELYSLPGRGTVLNVELWPNAHVSGESRGAGVAVLTRPMANEEVCGDTGAVIDEGERRVLVLADGLGHGPLAATASRAAVRVLLEAPELEPTAAIAEMNRQLGRTRGAAVAVVTLDRQRGIARHAGVGNISCFVVEADGRRRSLASLPGIVGAPGARRLRAEEVALSPGASVVLHSDGMSEKWDPSAYPGLARYSATVLAGLLMRDAAVRLDDASVVVARHAP